MITTKWILKSPGWLLSAVSQVSSAQEHAARSNPSHLAKHHHSAASFPLIYHWSNDIICRFESLVTMQLECALPPWQNIKVLIPIHKCFRDLLYYRTCRNSRPSEHIIKHTYYLSNSLHLEHNHHLETDPIRRHIDSGLWNQALWYHPRSYDPPLWSSLVHKICTDTQAHRWLSKLLLAKKSRDLTHRMLWFEGRQKQRTKLFLFDTNVKWVVAVKSKSSRKFFRKANWLCKRRDIHGKNYCLSVKSISIRNRLRVLPACSVAIVCECTGVCLPCFPWNCAAIMQVPSRTSHRQ